MDSGHSLPEHPNSIRGSVFGGAENLIRGTTPWGWNTIAAAECPMRRPRPSIGVTGGPFLWESLDCTGVGLGVKSTVPPYS